MFEKLKKLIEGNFFKNVAVLLTGTAIAQGLAFAASPILSRIYDPTAFGLFGLFMAFSGIIAVISSGKYELAILVPKKHEDAAKILCLSIFIVSGVSLLSLIVVIFFRYEIAGLLGSYELAPFLLWAPASIFFTGLYSAFNYWTTRRKQFKRLSISRVIQTSGREGTQLGVGFFTSLQGMGLVLGQVIGQAVSATALITQTFKEDFNFIRSSFNINGIKEIAKDHNYFPKFNAPQDFLNSISQNLPAILLAFFFNPGVVGLYWFTHRILLAPNQLIGGSVRQVFYQRANELVNDGKNPFDVYWKATKGLALIGLLPLMVTIIAGPIIFTFVFGLEWFEAGKYAQWLIIWWFMGFINSPSVMMIPILKLQKVQLLYEILLITFRIIAIAVGGFLESPLISIALFSITGFLFNAVLILYINNILRSINDSHSS